MLKPLVVCVTCVAVLLSAPAISMAQSREAESLRMVQGTIAAVDRTGRTVTIQSLVGNTVTLEVPASATRFEKVNVGDSITATYYDHVSLRLKSAGEPWVGRRSRRPRRDKHCRGGTLAKQWVTTVTITGWSPVDKVVSFTGPNGMAYSRGLLDSTDPKIIEGLKVGDRVDVTRTEALTVSVLPAFRHRLTFSALFGWDNQFSGVMIKQATGATTGGQAINLDETTYDEVYGRIGSLKLGVGYRTTPRTEGVFNFVWSSSDSETPVHIGGVGGAAQFPLNVNFTEYKYWGLEAGQRWYFARTRFTPFVGYLVGFNRLQDIRGRFVNVPLSVTPGLAAQDGKFFEKSWALSLGPTAGVLIGVGLIEVMIETQLRYMGGLSDVDWLVEEGLRDVNSDSSRWSLPLLFGARIRL
jgi:hypothetical protein